MLSEDDRIRYQAAKNAAQFQGRDLLEKMDQANLIWTQQAQRAVLERRAMSIETLPISYLLPEGKTVETATLNDLRKGIAEWLRRSA